MDHAQWAVAAMTGRVGVALVVPDGFEAYVRLLHPLLDGRHWSAAAPDYLRAGTEPYPYPFPEPVQNVEGDMSAAVVDALVPVLAGSMTSPDCHYALWIGWGELHPGSTAVAYARGGGRSPVAVLRSRRQVRRLARTRRRTEALLYSFVDACAVQPWWGGRDMLLFDGPLDAVTTIGSAGPFEGQVRRRGPQWWWPADRSWFVATEIDYPWSYVAGSNALIASLMSDQALETVRVRPSDRW